MWSQVSPLLLISCLPASHLWLYNHTSIVTHSSGTSSSPPPAGTSSSSPPLAGTFSSSSSPPPAGTSSSSPRSPAGTSSSSPRSPAGTSSSSPQSPAGTSSSSPRSPAGTSSPAGYPSAPPSHSPIDPPCDPAQLTTNENYAEVQLKTNTSTTQLYAVIAPKPAVAPSGCHSCSTPPSETPSDPAPPTVDENYAEVQLKTGHPNTTTGVIAPLPAVAPSLPPPRCPSTPSSQFPSYPAPPTVDENYAEVKNNNGHPNTTQLYAVIAPLPAVAPSLPPPRCPSTPSSHFPSYPAPPTMDENYAEVQNKTGHPNTTPVIAPLPAVAPSLPPSQCPSTPSSQFPSYPAPPTVDENYAEVQNKTGHPNTTQLYAVIASLPAVTPSLPPPRCPSTPPSHSPSDPVPSTVDAMVKQNTVNPPDQVSAKTYRIRAIFGGSLVWHLLSYIQLADIIIGGP